MQVTNWPIENVKPFHNNSRIHDEKSIKAITASVDRFSWLQPIVVDKDGVIVMGHGRLAAAKELGMTDVPVLVADWLTDNEVAAAREADNMTQDLSYFDMELLNMNLGEIDWLDIDMSEFGFKLDDELFGESEEDDYTEDNASAAPSRVQRGEIWQLGEHRLMCGDSTSETDVKALMGEHRADVCFTSPPYNMAEDKRFDSANINAAMGQGNAYSGYDDNLSADEYASFLTNAIENALRFSDDAMFNVGILKGSKIGLLTALFNHKENLSDIIVWNKSQSMPSGLPDHAGMVSHRCELIFCFNDRGTRMFSHPQWSVGTQINRIDTENASGNEYAKIHSATFPVSLASSVIKDYTENSVLDLFGGTGTTLIAAEQLGRKCYMMELDPHYCDVIIDRWEKLTGKEAVRL